MSMSHRSEIEMYHSSRFDDDQMSDEDYSESYDENSPEALRKRLPESTTEFYYAFPDGYADYLREIWCRYVTGTKYANRERLSAILRDLGFRPSYADIESYFKAYVRPNEIDEYGFAPTGVNFQGLCDIIKVYMQDTDISLISSILVSAFRVFDNEQEGYVNTSTLESYLQLLPEIIDKSEISKLLVEMDESDEGYISYETFISRICDGYVQGLQAHAPKDQVVVTKEDLERPFKELQLEQPVVVDTTAILQARIKQLKKQKKREKRLQKKRLQEQLEQMKAARRQARLDAGEEYTAEDDAEIEREFAQLTATTTTTTSTDGSTGTGTGTGTGSEGEGRAEQKTQDSTATTPTTTATGEVDFTQEETEVGNWALDEPTMVDGKPRKKKSYIYKTKKAHSEKLKSRKKINKTRLGQGLGVVEEEDDDDDDDEEEVGIVLATPK